MKRAFVTLVNDHRYIEGAKVLSHSLHETGTQFPLVMLVSGLGDDDLAQLSRTPAIIHPVEHIEVETRGDRNFPPRSKTFSKINAWRLTQFDTCVFLDADILVVKSIDYLFEYPEFSAVGSRGYFNTGVFVFEPRRETYDRLCDVMHELPEDSTYGDDSEQEMLQRVFRDQFTPLPYRSNYRPYHRKRFVQNRLMRWEWARNLLLRLKSPWTTDLIHFIGYPKPWELYVPGCRRDSSHYTWTERQLRGARWSFEMWYEAWLKYSNP